MWHWRIIRELLTYNCLAFPTLYGPTSEPLRHLRNLLARRDMILAKELMRTCYEGYQAMAAKLAPEIWRFKTSVGCIAHTNVIVSQVLASAGFCVLPQIGKPILSESWSVHWTGNARYWR